MTNCFQSNMQLRRATCQQLQAKCYCTVPTVSYFILGVKVCHSSLLSAAGWKSWNWLVVWQQFFTLVEEHCLSSEMLNVSTEEMGKMARTREISSTGSGFVTCLCQWWFWPMCPWGLLFWRMIVRSDWNGWRRQGNLNHDLTTIYPSCTVINSSFNHDQTSFNHS